MTTRYKLTDADDRTRGETQWGPGVTHEAPGTGELCNSGWIHVYDDPVLAVLMDPIQGNFGADAHLWRCECLGAERSDGTKRGVASCTTVERVVDLPAVTTEQRVRFAILCAQEVCRDPAWRAWADGWLTGRDRNSGAAAARAAREAVAAAGAARAAAEAAAWAAAAAEAAAAEAAWAAAEAAAAAEAEAAWAAAAAAWAAAAAAGKIDLVAMAHRAVES